VARQTMRGIDGRVDDNGLAAAADLSPVRKGRLAALKDDRYLCVLTPMKAGYSLRSPDLGGTPGVGFPNPTPRAGRFL
jgi:hypothetical protein